MFFIFLVRGIVDKINEITNKKVIPTRLKNVILESSSSPNEIVMYKFNFYKIILINLILAKIRC